MGRGGKGTEIKCGKEGRDKGKEEEGTDKERGKEKEGRGVRGRKGRSGEGLGREWKGGEGKRRGECRLKECGYIRHERKT